MVKVEDLIPLMEEAFREDKTFTMPIRGTSMRPIWHTGTLVELSKIDEVHKKDVLFFKRLDGGYVLHRLWKIKKGKYYMIGDHQIRFEIINPEQCFAKVTAYYVKNKRKEMKGFRYRLYCLSLRCWLIRGVYMKCLH